jgi:hypothetical protein
MRNLSIALAALATIAVAAPSIASAEEIGVGVRVGGDRESHRDRGEYREHRQFRGERAEFGEHRRGYYRGHRDVVVIHRHRRHWDD